MGCHLWGCTELDTTETTSQLQQHLGKKITWEEYSQYLNLLLFFVIFSAAAAKSLQSCPALCDPIDGSPPGSAVPGILQARILEWVAISFSEY